MNLQKTMKLLYEIKALMAFIMLMQVGLLVLNVANFYRLYEIEQSYKMEQCDDCLINFWLFVGFIAFVLREIRSYQQSYNKKTNNQETQST